MLDIPLNYQKGWISQGPYCAGFKPWVDDFYELSIGGIGVCAPQPLFTDIEFDVFGNMLIGLGDRGAFQLGFDYGTRSSDTYRYAGFTAGDLLKLYNNNGTLLMENNSTSGYTTTLGKNTGSGINGGEYYYEDGLPGIHEETILGGLAVHPSSDAVITTVIDAVHIWANGWKQLSNSTGKAISRYDIVVGENAGQAKAASLGDLELLVGSSLPKGIGIEVGNYVWNDRDEDGIQDPSEEALPGIPLELYLISGGDTTLVERDTSGTDGSYRFSDLLPTSEYMIILGTANEYDADKKIVINGVQFQPTQANTAINNGNDENDSDGSSASAAFGQYEGRFLVTFTTAVVGANNYSFDFGLVLFGLGNLVWNDYNFNGKLDRGEPGVSGVKVTLHDCSGGVVGDAVPGYQKVTTGGGFYGFQGMPAGDYALSFDYSGLSDTTKVHFTIPNIQANGLDSIDSDASYTTVPFKTKEFSSCFHWYANPGEVDLRYDAGLVFDQDKDGIPDELDTKDNIIDPTGFIYCENNGEVIDSGLISVTGPGNVFLVHNGEKGYYQFFVDLSGDYTIELTTPPTYDTSTVCLDQGSFDAPTTLYTIGKGDGEWNDLLDDYTCANNKFYTTLHLDPGDLF